MSFPGQLSQSTTNSVAKATENLLSHCSGSQKPKVKVSARLVSSEGCRMVGKKVFRAPLRVPDSLLHAVTCGWLPPDTFTPYALSACLSLRLNFPSYKHTGQTGFSPTLMTSS